MPDKGNFGAVVQVAHALRGEGFDASEDGTGRGTPLVAHPTLYAWQNDREGLKQDNVAAALRASAGSSGFHEMNHPVVVFPTLRAGGNSTGAQAVGTDCYNGAITGDVAATMGTTGSGVNGCGPTVMSFKPGQSAAVRTIGASVDVACTLESGGGGNNQQAVAFQACGDRDNPSISTSESAFCLPANAMSDRGQAVAHAMNVRRLTPRECERLSGFPDDWTLVPYRGKPACDGPRYKAIGNSMAVNCMQWIGERIAHHEARPG